MLELSLMCSEVEAVGYSSSHSYACLGKILDYSDFLKNKKLIKSKFPQLDEFIYHPG
jgi:hypothetical protein